jgi:integrase
LDYGQPTAADRLEKIKCADPAPRILTVAEAKAILTNMEDIWSLLYVVISVFTGIRHDELQRLTFKQITPGEVIDITTDISGQRQLELSSSGV